MALFSSKKNTDIKAPVVAKTAKATKVKKEVAVRPAVISTGAVSVNTRVIIRPRVTEKAALLSEHDGRTVVVFEVMKGATKRTVSDAVQALYKVTPEKVAILRVPPKKSFIRGHVTNGKTTYKAYVYLKKGETIELA